MLRLVANKMEVLNIYNMYIDIYVNFASACVRYVACKDILLQRPCYLKRYCFSHAQKHPCMHAGGGQILPVEQS